MRPNATGRRDGRALVWRGFYAIVDVDCLEQRDLVGVAEELLLARPVALQLRAKRATARELFGAAIRLRALVRECPLIVNDRLDVAIAAEADGVHLGQGDLPLAVARALVPRGFIVGVSTHSLGQAISAAAAGASYVGFGPVFATSTKEKPDPVQGLEQLAEVLRAVSIPVVAIGGVTRENAGAVAATGCVAATSIAGVLGADDVTLAARELGMAFGAHY